MDKEQVAIHIKEIIRQSELDDGEYKSILSHLLIDRKEAWLGKIKEESGESSRRTNCRKARIKKIKRLCIR